MYPFNSFNPFASFYNPWMPAAKPLLPAYVQSEVQAEPEKQPYLPANYSPLGYGTLSDQNFWQTFFGVMGAYSYASSAARVFNSVNSPVVDQPKEQLAQKIKMAETKQVDTAETKQVDTAETKQVDTALLKSATSSQTSRVISTPQKNTAKPVSSSSTQKATKAKAAAAAPKAPAEKVLYPSMEVYARPGKGHCFEKEAYYFMQNGKLLNAQEVNDLLLEGDRFITKANMAAKNVQLVATDGSKLTLRGDINTERGGVIPLETNNYNGLNATRTPKMKLKDGTKITNENVGLLALEVNGSEDAFPIVLDRDAEYGAWNKFQEHGISFNTTGAASYVSAYDAYINKVVIDKNADGSLVMTVVSEDRFCEQGLYATWSSTYRTPVFPNPDTSPLRS